VKYLIHWNSGYGDDYAVEEAKTETKAIDIAYEFWREEAEGNATYDVQVLTKELAEDYGFEDEL
jgi:hypothetical protein